MISLLIPVEQNHLSHPKYRADIDGLRAIAVLCVVGFHAFPEWVRGGFIGVDIFFVISGFLISSIILSGLEKGSFSFRVFYARRVMRIFPALIAVMTACFAIGWFALLPNDFAQLGKHIVAGAGFMSNFLLWLESGYFDSASETKPLLHLWSLGIEEQFYIIWPLLICLAWKRRVSFLFVVITIGLVSFAANVGLRHSDPIQDFFSPLTRFWELMSGGILAYLALHGISPWRLTLKTLRLDQGKAGAARTDHPGALSNVQSILGVLMLGMALVLVTSKVAFPGWWALLPTLGTCLIVSAGPNAWLNRTVLSVRTLVWLGLISYPLYLWHWPLLVFARIIDVESPSVELRCVLIAAAFVLAWLTYRLLEYPIRFGKPIRSIVTALALAMAAVAGAGYATFATNGFSFRYPPEIRGLATIVNPYQFFDVNAAWRDGKCHSVPIGVPLDRILGECVERARPTVLLWGDSFAAALYPGLKGIQKDGNNTFGIAQFTEGNGPPFFDKEGITSTRKALSEFNNQTLSVVSLIKPSIVLLTWTVYGENAIPDMQVAVASLEKTVQKIRKESPGSEVVVVGPVPRWNGHLFNLMIQYWKETGAYPPEYMHYGLDNQPDIWDSYMSDQLSKRGIRYISVMKVMCNDAGCLTRVGDQPTDLTAVDWAHLTPAGSYYLMRRIEDQIFGPSGKSGNQKR